jgi:hypothetical protein
VAHAPRHAYLDAFWFHGNIELIRQVEEQAAGVRQSDPSDRYPYEHHGRQAQDRERKGR